MRDHRTETETETVVGGNSKNMTVDSLRIISIIVLTPIK
jgi:hypothetical protein